jgi:DnaJ-class molecular chaperone
MSRYLHAAKNNMTMKLTEKTCTACKGSGVSESNFSGNTKVSPSIVEECVYCGGTGSRKYQIFNWMKDPNGEKYISKDLPKGFHKKEEL